MNQREICPGCLYIKVRCLCDYINPIYNETHLIILQHPSEVRHALNTARLMKLSFKKISLFIGENFSQHEELNHFIKSPFQETSLLFPDPHSMILDKSENKKITNLIVIDGTWKKAKKIFYLSENLHSLRRISLSPETKSLYRIRSSKWENSLSTLEATVLALREIEPHLDTSTLESSFKKMIDFQINMMGEETFRLNYLDKKKGDE